MKKEYDLIFVGRKCREKGLTYVNNLKQDFKVLEVSGVPYEKMPEYYNKAKILVVPSMDVEYWREQWPACIAEALACEIPAVVFDSGNIKDNYGKCEAVIFVEQKNLRQMKQKIKRLLRDDRLREELRRKGRDFIVRNYSNEVISRKLLEALKDVCIRN